MTNSGAIRVVGYTRVSTENQVQDGMGLEIQRDIIGQYCEKQKDIELLRIYSDPGVSGSIIKRPGLSELLRDAKNGEFSKVIIAKLDRLARELYVQLFIEKELMVHDIDVFSVAEPYKGQDPMSVAMRQMVGVFAELEKGRITERLISGRQKKFSIGGYAGGNLSLGYDSVDGVLKINPKEAAIVGMIKKWRRRGLSLRVIATRLNEKGVKTKRGGNVWYASTIRSVIKNGIYKGKVRYNGSVIKGAHQAISEQ